MQKPARRHHYISEFYLKGFAPDPGKPQLFVVDLKEGRSYRSNTRDIGLEGDFHTVEAEGQSPDVVEKEIAKLEGEIAPALARMLANATFANDDDKALILTFAILLLIKNPMMRSTIDGFVNQVMNYIGKSQAENPEAFAKKVARMIEDGEMPKDTDVEKLRQAILSDDYTIRLSTEAHLQMEFDIAKSLFPLVAERKWNIYKATEGQFVTCDRPVALIWADPKKQDPIGLNHKNTLLILPLSPTIAISGGFELKDDTVEVGAEDVAKINGRIILNAGRRVFARDDQFEYMLQHNSGSKRGSDLEKDALVEKKSAE